ncbi:MAG: hypothetical protein AB2693_10335 [Candidatus Thiodiazotropha sp.]
MITPPGVKMVPVLWVAPRRKCPWGAPRRKCPWGMSVRGVTLCGPLFSWIFPNYTTPSLVFYQARQSRMNQC